MVICVRHMWLVVLIHRHTDYWKAVKGVLMRLSTFVVLVQDFHGLVAQLGKKQVHQTLVFYLFI